MPKHRQMVVRKKGAGKRAWYLFRGQPGILRRRGVQVRNSALDGGETGGVMSTEAISASVYSFFRHF